MRALSLRQISNCEEAREHVCRCRCGGALHGARRGSGQGFFAALPADDAHHFVTKAERTEKQKMVRADRAKRRHEALLSLYSDVGSAIRDSLARETC